MSKKKIENSIIISYTYRLNIYIYIFESMNEYFSPRIILIYREKRKIKNSYNKDYCLSLIFV